MTASDGNKTLHATTTWGITTKLTACKLKREGGESEREKEGQEGLLLQMGKSHFQYTHRTLSCGGSPSRAWASTSTSTFASTSTSTFASSQRVRFRLIEIEGRILNRIAPHHAIHLGPSPRLAGSPTEGIGSRCVVRHSFASCIHQRQI